MHQPEVLALGFDPTHPDARLPQGLVETGWPILVQLGWPSDGWLAGQRADLVAVRMAGVDRVAERTRTLGRLRGGPVVWFVDPGAEEPADLWQHLPSKDWPAWTVLPLDAPRWQVVAACRSLLALATRLERAQREAEEAARRLEDRKLIERAKGILMDRFDLAESEAYKRLRDTAMRQRKPLREIAQSLIEFVALEPTAPPAAKGGAPDGGQGRGGRSRRLEGAAGGPGDATDGRGRLEPAPGEGPGRTEGPF